MIGSGPSAGFQSGVISRWVMGLAMLTLLLMIGTGCVRRTLTVETEPSGALVYLNDEEVGRSPVTTDFTWYGDYDVIVRRDGYQTLKIHANVPPPWYQLPPIDFAAEVLWPGWIVDRHTLSYKLEPQELPSRTELVNRAEEMRDRALFQAE